MHHYPKHLVKLIENLKKFPGVGQKSAERYAFNLLEWNNSDLTHFAEAIGLLKKELKICGECGCLERDTGCPFCHQDSRAKEVMCVVSHFKDVFAIEETHEFKGLYHVLGGVLSPLEGKGPEHLTVGALKSRIQACGVSEVVVAIDATLEGDATALYLKQELEPLDVAVSRLAFGLPMGSALDYVDGSTLAKALLGRRNF